MRCVLALVVLAVPPAVQGQPPRTAVARETIVVALGSAVPSVGAALRLAHAGARIVVRAGVYREPTILVDKPVQIVGDSGAVIDGEGARQIMTIAADDVTLTGLTLRNVGSSMIEDRAAVKVVGARGCVIARNRIEDAFFGIYLSNATGCRLSHNIIHASSLREQLSGNGIHLWSSTSITIDSNTVSGHRDGIYFEFVHNSTITANVSERNLRYGLHFMFSDDCRYRDNVFRNNGSGVAVMFTHRVEMVGNRFEDSWGGAAYGLLLKEISDSRLERNLFLGNTVGLFADGADRLIATGNEFRDNGWAIKLMASSQNARFDGNNFIGNTFDVATNSRQSSTTMQGNYWDQYEGYDLDRDGIGDVPQRPVRLFSLLVAQHEPAMILMRSFFVGLLDAAERAIPSLTPEALTDARPAMRRIRVTGLPVAPASRVTAQTATRRDTP